MQLKLSVQQEDFDINACYSWLCDDNKNSGGICLFVGRVREMQGEEALVALHLEHFPGMTENVLQEIAEEANKQWPCEKIVLIHRIGNLGVNEQIVLVATASAHRDHAYRANEFIMDYLKTKAPFWKKALYEGREQWVEAKQQDFEKAKTWKS